MTWNKIFGFVAVALVLVTSLFAVPTYAQANFSFSTVTGGVSGNSSATSVNNITNLIGTVANIVIGIIAAISVFYIIFGAVTWMNGDAKGGQEKVVNAVIGLVIAILAFFIVQFAVGTGGFLNNALNNTK